MRIPRKIKDIVSRISLAVFRFQVSGVRCQQQNSTRWVGVAHKMDFLSTVLAFSCTSISVLDSARPGAI